jgi:hypothetical protein
MMMGLIISFVIDVVHVQRCIEGRDRHLGRASRCCVLQTDGYMVEKEKLPEWHRKLF